MSQSRITFLPYQRSIEVSEGDSLIRTALQAGVHINASCGGEGVCAKCRVQVEQGEVAEGLSERFSPEDIEAGYRLAREGPPDLIVLDMIMDPGIDGCETYRRIIQHHPGQRAIVASGFSESERFREIQRLGVGTYLKKPYTLEKIAMAVRRELERPAPDAGGGRPDARTSTG